LLLATLLGLPALLGCLGEPEIDERWTLLEMLSTDPVPGEDLSAGQALNVTVSGRITYRAIRTGFLVAEVRYSDTLGPAAMALDPEDHSLATAHRVERVLNNSVTVGRGTKAVTGFNQLMQTVNLSFDAVAPSNMFGSNPDSMAHRGLYLVLYLAEGDEIELAGGRDSLVVTPFPVDEYEVLHTGFALDVQAPAPGGTP
jgi:hypothetical protein